MKQILLVIAAAFLLNACANHGLDNQFYEQAAINGVCNEKFFTEQRAKVDKNDDTIYTGINTGALARDCQLFEQSNYLFDKAEDAYKFDVDLQGLGTKSAKTAASTLVNASALDYEGTLYERIMVNVYKGLNFMSLNDFENARVEFNRALMRQDKAKEYFAKEIEANRKDFDKAKEDPNYAQNMGQNASAISQRYEHLLKDFATTQDFINPYATYMASVFFFLDGDYKRAADLFKEVAVLQANSAEFNKEFKAFEEYSKSLNPSKLGKFIFVVYESGFGAGLDEFRLSLPFFVSGGKGGKNVVNAALAMPTLKKRANSYEFISANGERVSDFVNFDDIIATEFKANMSTTIAKALSSAIVKTVINVAVAKNDPTGGYLALATSLINAGTTKADVRVWNSLPKHAKITMLENTGQISILADDGKTLYENAQLDKDKNALVVVKSYAKGGKAVVWVIQR